MSVRREPASGPTSERLIWPALLALLVLAAALRLPFLGHQSLWYDEIFTRGVISEPSLTGLWHHVQRTESTPPLFYLVEWLIGARSAVAMRLVPALALIAAVPASYFALRRFVGRGAAMAGAAIVAVSPDLVQFSMDARAYGLFVLTALLSLWAFSAVLEESSRRRWAAWALAGATCIWTHYFGAVLVAGEAIILLIALADRRTATAGWCALIAIAAAPLIPMVSRQNGDARADFIATTSLSSRLTGTVRQFAMGANVPRSWLEGAGLVLAVGGVLVGCLIAWRSGGGARRLVVLATFTLAAPLALAVLRIEDRFYARNLLFLVPVAAALAAPALLRARAVPLALYLALAVLTSLWVASDWRYEQVDWHTAVARMRAIDPSAAVLVVPRANTTFVTAGAYLGGSARTGPVTTSGVWIAVEPYRAPHHRELGPAPVPPVLANGLSGFITRYPLLVHGFRLILLTSDGRPAVVDPPPGTAVFGPPIGS